MANKAKSKEELAMAKLRCNIIKMMEECIEHNDEKKVYFYAKALQSLPIYLDYDIRNIEVGE